MVRVSILKRSFSCVNTRCVGVVPLCRRDAQDRTSGASLASWSKAWPAQGVGHTVGRARHVQLSRWPSALQPVAARNLAGASTQAVQACSALVLAVRLAELELQTHPTACQPSASCCCLLRFPSHMSRSPHHFDLISRSSRSGAPANVTSLTFHGGAGKNSASGLNPRFFSKNIN